jgi:hypothetical protein
VSRIRKKTFYLQFSMETPKGHQKCIFDTSKITKTKIHMGSIRQSLQAQPKTIKNIKSTNQNKNFTKKTMFSTLKVKRSQKFVWELPDGI